MGQHIYQEEERWTSTLVRLDIYVQECLEFCPLAQLTIFADIIIGTAIALIVPTSPYSHGMRNELLKGSELA
jgi:hypothetical protein